MLELSSDKQVNFTENLQLVTKQLTEHMDRNVKLVGVVNEKSAGSQQMAEAGEIRKVISDNASLTASGFEKVMGLAQMLERVRETSKENAEISKKVCVAIGEQWEDIQLIDQVMAEISKLAAQNNEKAVRVQKYGEGLAEKSGELSREMGNFQVQETGLT